MKRAQTEILGLLVIVILLVVIIGIVIMFSIGGVGGDGQTLRKNLQTTKLADSILQFTPACPGEVTKDLRKIIKDCNFQDNTQACGQPCKELITQESQAIIRSINARQPSLAYGAFINKTGTILALADCNGTTKIYDNTIDPAFTLTIIQCS